MSGVASTTAKRAVATEPPIWRTMFRVVVARGNVGVGEVEVGRRRDRHHATAPAPGPAGTAWRPGGPRLVLAVTKAKGMVADRHDDDARRARPGGARPGR